MSVPSRPSDQTIQNIGFYYKAPTDNNLYKINNDLANQPYASDCQTISTNGDVPEPRFEIDTYSDNVTEDNLIFSDDDGTVRRYFIHGDEEVSDNFCENAGITDADYQSLSADAKEFYCDAVGGKVTATSITGPGSQFDADQNLTIYEKNVSGTGAEFQAIIDKPTFNAGLTDVSGYDLRQVDIIIMDTSNLDNLTGGGGHPYDNPNILSGQMVAGLRERCDFFLNDLFYRYLGRQAEQGAIDFYGEKIWDLVSQGNPYGINEFVVKDIRNSPEGQAYAQRLRDGTVEKPTYSLPVGYYTSASKWKQLWGQSFFNKSFYVSGGGKLIQVQILNAGQGYEVGNTFGVSQTNNDSATDAEFKITSIDSTGSIRYLKQPVCNVVREISRPVGVEIWNSQDEDSDNTTDCATIDSFINKAIVEGTVGGTVFGSGPYASSSDIATAAVHAGLIEPGQLAEIAWYSASSDLIANFSGSTKNGVTSYSSDTILSGVLKNLDITTPGNLANSTTTVKPKQVNGSGAEIVIQLNASFNVVSVSVPTGGNSYKVGDTFEVVSSYDGVNENPAILTVTEVDDITVSGSCGINLELNRIISSDDDVCENPTEILTLVVDSDNPESNLRYLVEKEIGLTYVDPSRDIIIDQVQDIDGSGSSDDVLSESANLTLNLFMEKISRLPSVVEFQQYTRLYYGVGAVQTDEIINQFYVQFEDELDVPNQVTSVTSKCDRLNVSPPTSEDNGDDNCVYDRRNFFNPGVHGTSLKSLWEFLGRPANQNSVQDNEPDMSDFAGMTLQRWKPCDYHTSDSNFGGMVLDVVPDQGQSSNYTGAIDLSWFTNTRLPPWWGTLSLAPPVLSNASRTDDIIYLINSPSDQTEIYKGFSENDNTSNPKNQFELKFVVNWPAMTGEVGPGRTNPAYRKFIDVTWYKKIPGQAPEPRARVQYSNVPDLEPQGFQNGVVTSYPDTPSLEILNSNQSEFVTTLTIEQLQGDSNISKQDALEISYDELPNSGTYYYAKVTVENKPIDQDSGTFIPGVGSSDIKQNDSSETFCKFLTNEEIQTQICWNGDVIPVTSTCPPGPTCPNGEKVCSNGEKVCIEDNCPPVTPSQNCNSLSVSCGSSQKINVFTNSDTSITFSYRVNNASNCSEKGTAKVSIRRYWPCGIFGVARDFANVWLVQKKTVSIVNGVAEYTLKVNTTRDDYLQGADCHWIYVAYWEIDHSKIDCRFDAWDNPGCDYDDVSDALEEILCIQQQTCTGKGSSITNVDRGKVTSYEILNPYPDPRLINFINVRDFAGFGEFNPATVDGNNWNWYYDCVPKFNGLSDSEGDLIPGEGYEVVTITGSGSGFSPALQFATFQNSTRGPDGDVTMTKGCRDSSNDFVQWYVGAKSKLQDIPGIFDQGYGYAVGDIVEFRALDQDPETVPVRIRITQIQPSLITAQCGTECPICEQSIEVVISDTTECGPVDFPRMIENNAAPGGLVNNGAFGIGGGTDIVWFTIPNDYPIILGKDQAKIKTDSRGNQYLDVRLWAEVLIQSAVVGDQLTSGRYNAVQFSGVDYSSVISNCCGDNPPGAGSFECNNFVSSGGCLEDNSENSLQVECNAEVRVVAHWYYKRTDANGAQDAGYIPFLNYNEDGVAVSQVPEDYYPVSAGNNPSAMFMSYDSEESYKNGLHKASLFRGGQIARKLYYPNDVKSVEIFLELKSSNDEWGKEIYHPPPRGWNERDFGTTTQVSSLRAPWLIQGQAAYGPKDRIFSVGKFGISDVLELPTVDWIARIDGCADAQVYAPLDYQQGGTYLCGDKNSPNWYQCEYSMFGKNSVANETWRLNGEDGTSNGGPAFYGEVCAPELVGFPDCLPKTDVVLKANTQDGSGLFTINWKDIPVPSECAQGLKLLWYIDGVCVTPGQSNDIFKPYKLLSCGPSEAEIDLSANMTNPNKSYEVECIIVLNNGLYVANKNVNFNWTTQNGDDYNYSDREDWAVKRSTRRQPININQDIRSGDFYQIIVSRAGCKVKGNDGPGEPPPYVAPPTNPSISIELSVNGPTTVELDNGQVTMEFTARIQYDQGGYYPSDAPNLFTYGIAVSQEFTYNTEFTWTETFTNANTYEIPVQINKNFCPPGVGTTDECDGRIFVTAKATVLVTIEAESVPPTVTPQPAEYSTNDEDGCGLSVNGKDVTITQTILITQGTGKYEWDDVQVSAQGWNHYDQGSKLIRTFTINHATNDDKVTGGKVIFYKNNQEVYSEFTGPMTYCVNAISIPTATAVAATYSREQNGCGLILDGVPVEIYQNIEITQGTGQYEWDEVTTTSGDYERDGTTLTQTITRSRTSNGQYGTTVIFLKNGSEVHREGSGANTWCTIVSNSSPPESDPNPSNPGNSDTNEK